MRGAHPSGTVGTASVSVAYAYRHDGTFGFDDRQGLLFFPGLALEFSAARGPLHSAISVRGYPIPLENRGAALEDIRLDPPNAAEMVLRDFELVFGKPFDVRRQSFKMRMLPFVWGNFDSKS